MPLIAKNKQTGDRVNILEYPNLREEFQKGDLVCPLCDDELIIVAGHIRINHFRHKPNAPCKSDYDKHPESWEHLFFKKLLSEKLSQEFSEYLNAKPILEYPIREVKRIADIVFQFSNGWLVAHEVQLSSIITEELQKRTNDYRNAGVDVVWWLGKSANTTTNRRWIIENFGECYTLDWETVYNNREKVCEF